MTTKIKILVILLLSGLLLSFVKDDRKPRPYTYKPLPREIFKRQQLLRFDFENKQLANLAVAYSSGHRSGLTKKMRLAHQRLHLQHLFTPSGLHFSALLIFLSPLLFWTPKRGLFLFTLALLCLPWTLEGFYSIKRISALKIAHLMAKKMGIKISPFTLFLVVFLIDFFVGTYRDSPLSFSYSFLFLGLIFATFKEAKITMIASLMLGQVLVGYLNSTEIYPLGFVLGFMATSAFSLVFPLMLAGFLSAPLFSMSWLEPLVKMYIELIDLFSQLSFALEEAFYPSTAFIFALLLFLGLNRKRFLLLCLLNTTPLLNTHPTHYWAPPHYQKVTSTQAQKLKVAYRGWSYTNQAKQKCLAKYYEKEGWREYCREYFKDK